MKLQRTLTLVLGLVLLLTSLTACGSNQVDIEVAVAQTLSAAATIDQAVREASAATSAPVVEPPAATETPPAVEPTATSTVVHVTIPSSPAGVTSFMTDRSTALLASERRAIADNYDINLLERPFSPEAMDYKDYLDITRGELSLNPPFVYVTIQLEGGAPADQNVAYGVEIDLDLDGHGDWLILGQAPPDSTWTTDGVRACRDANNDVGGPTAMRVDAPNSARDGYEDCIFENGFGLSPDEAWIRRDPSHANYVQIAFLFSLIGSDGEFLWGAWSDEGLREPAFFDYHDHFTITEAGSPASESSYYPLKAVALLDNTCRWGYGFTPTGTEPGACYVPPTATPVPLGSISGLVWNDVNNNSAINPSEGPRSGLTVNLHQGGCGGSVIASTTTSGTGTYSFSGLIAGDYCVEVVVSGGCGGLEPSAGLPNPRNLTLGGGENKGGVNFGFWYYIC